MMHYHEERTLAQFEDSSTLRRSIILAAALSPAFAALFVGLRFYTARAILRGGIHKDDCEFFFFFPFLCHSTRRTWPRCAWPRCCSLLTVVLSGLILVALVRSYGSVLWEVTCSLA